MRHPTGPVSDALDVSRQALAGHILRWTEQGHLLETKVPGLFLVRYEAPTEPMSVMYDPCICLVAQGAKRALLGDELYYYDANRYLITSVGLPVVANVVEASEEAPFLGMVLKIDLNLVSQLMVDNNQPASGNRQSGRGMAVREVSLPLLSAFQRMLDLLEQPQDIEVLSPLIHKEILYRILMGGQGPRLIQIAAAGIHGRRIARAIDWLRENYAKQFRIENLAKDIGMSTSTFHQHFRAVTAMSPLQYQKKMRLLEARRLMLTEQQDVTSAALQVGYESPSQFSREYKRQFGAPPLRDIKSLQEVSA